MSDKTPAQQLRETLRRNAELVEALPDWIRPDGVKSRATSPDPVDHPSHYGGADDPYEAIKVIDAWELGFALGNTVKYIARAGRKDPAKLVEDLKKARWYLDYEIRRQAASVTEPAQDDVEEQEGATITVTSDGPAAQELAESAHLGRMQLLATRFAVNGVDSLTHAEQKDLSAWVCEKLAAEFRGLSVWEGLSFSDVDKHLAVTIGGVYVQPPTSIALASRFREWAQAGSRYPEK